MFMENVVEGVGNDFDPPRTSNSEVLPFELFRYLILPSHTKTFGDQSTDWVSTAKRTNAAVGFLKGDRNSACEEGLEETRSFACCKLVDEVLEVHYEEEGLSVHIVATARDQAAAEQGEKVARASLISFS